VKSFCLGIAMRWADGAPEEMVQAVIERWAGLEVAINNAGVNPARSGPGRRNASVSQDVCASV
jgi:hypothetical protein